MLEIIVVILFVISLVATGLTVSGYLPMVAIDSLIKRLAWSGLLGSSVVSLVLWLVMSLGMTQRWQLIGVVLAVMIILIASGWSRLVPLVKQVTWPKMSLVAWLMALIIVLIVASSLWQALTRPVLAYDSLYVWSFRAKLWFFRQYDQSGILSQGSWHSNYPLQVSLLQYWINVLAGRFSDTLVNVVAWFYYVTGAMLIYGFLRDRLARWQSQWWVLIYLTLPLIWSHSYQGYADLPLAIYILAMFVLWYYYWELTDKRLLMASGLVLGLGLMVKLDVLMVIMAVGLCCQWSAWRQWRDWLVMVLLGASPWLAYLIWSQQGISNVGGGLAWRPETIGSLFYSMLVLANWQVLFYLLAFVVLYYYRTLWRQQAIKKSYQLLVSYSLVLSGLYVLTEAGVYALNQTAVSRNLMLVVPIVVLVTALSVKAIDKNNSI